jgi:hypothetical protein
MNTSFLFNGGYNATRNEVINFSLKKTNLWNNGIVSVNNHTYLYKLYSRNDTKLEMVKYNNKYALLANNMIIFENEELFSYNIELLRRDNELLNHHNDIIIKDNIQQESINFEEMKEYSLLRYTN